MEASLDEEERELCAEILENWNTPITIHSKMVHQNPFSTLYHSSCVETKIVSTSKRKYIEGNTRMMKPAKDKWTDEKSNSIIPVLVADTFYDKLLGRGADGIDIKALVKYNTRSPISGGKRCLFAAENTVPSEFRLCTQRDFAHKLREMLSSNKKINIDYDFGEKMWRNRGVDTTDFFNYGLDEKQWEDYCKEMHALIHEGSSRPNKTDVDTCIESLEEGEICEAETTREYG